LSVNSPAPKLTARFRVSVGVGVVKVKVKVRVRFRVIVSVSVNENNSSVGELADKYLLQFIRAVIIPLYHSRHSAVRLISGSCVTDGLYYRDDTTFVICSNGYPHEQPCPPGTKTSGSPRYQPGYYYGYTDLCSVNLVDYGYGPEYYAPRG